MLVTEAPPLVSFVAVILPKAEGVVSVPSAATLPPNKLAAVQSNAAVAETTTVTFCAALQPVLLSILSIYISKVPAVFFEVIVRVSVVSFILVSKYSWCIFLTISLKSLVVPVNLLE